ncbi:sensor histidine kinase [Polaribacter sp. OB-PA-B3]
MKKNIVNLFSFKKLYLKEVIFFLILCLSFNVFSQDSIIEEITAFKDFENSSIIEITQDNNQTIWLRTNKGLLNYNGKYFSKSFKNRAIDSNLSTSLFINNDSIFIGNTKELTLITNNNVFTFEAKGVNKIFKHKNAYYVASNHGIYHFNKNYLQPLKTTYNLDFSIINDIIFHNNNFIVAANSGLWLLSDLFNPETISLISKGNFNNFKMYQNKLFVLKNKQTIFQLNPNKQLIEKYTSDEDINFEVVSDQLYLFSKQTGINVLNAETFIFEKRINKYNSKINSNTINAVFEDIKGNVFLATDNSFYIQKNREKLLIPNLYIEKVLVNYKLLDTINLNNYNKRLHLNAKSNSISITLNSNIFSTDKNIEYRFKLGNDFSPWQEVNQINFANLKTGNYTFIAEARFKNGKNSSSKSFSFIIKKPFYLEVWFYIVCTIALLLMIILFLEIHLKKLNKRNQKKIKDLKLKNHLQTLEQKALQLQMNPHFIFNVLNGIKALGNSEKKQELNETISSFSVLLRSVLNNSRLEEISLQEEITTLKSYLKLEQQISSKSFDFSIVENLNGIDSEEILIPPMLIQPFVENAIKHGISKINTKGNILVTFDVKQAFLHSTIVDNGIGIYNSINNNSENTHTSVAFKVTKERIENLSKYNVFTAEELKKDANCIGTKISFKIPLKTDY